MIEALGAYDFVGWAGRYALVTFRILGLFFFLPFLGSRLLPMQIRLLAVAMFSFVFLAFLPPIEALPADIVAWAVAGVRELAAGFVLGVTARAIFAGVEAAAQLVAGQTGFSLATMVDPASGDQSVAPSLFMNLIATTLLLSANLHHLFIRAIHESYRLLPPGPTLPDVGTLDRVTGLLGMRLFTVAVELAAPALIVTFSVDLVMVLVGKAMPQIPILIVGYPVKLAAGLIAIAMLASGTGAAIGWIGRTIASDGAAILAALGSG